MYTCICIEAAIPVTVVYILITITTIIITYAVIIYYYTCGTDIRKCF